MNIDDLALVCSVLVGISGSYWHQKFGRRWRILLAKTCYLVAVSTCRTMSPATQQRCSVIISIIASGAITLWIENTLWCFWTFRLTRGSELVDPCSINYIILWMIVTLLWSIYETEEALFSWAGIWQEGFDLLRTDCTIVWQVFLTCGQDGRGLIKLAPHLFTFCLWIRAHQEPTALDWHWDCRCGYLAGLVSLPTQCGASHSRPNQISRLRYCKVILFIHS